MTHFAGENTGLGGRWSSAYQGLLTSRQEYAKRGIRLDSAIVQSSETLRSVPQSDRGNVIRVDFGGGNLPAANRSLRQAIRSTEDFRAALFWIGLSAAAVLALGFLGA
jgi:hypothetical protein